MCQSAAASPLANSVLRIVELSNYCPKPKGRNTDHSAAKGGTSDLGSRSQAALLLALYPGDRSRVPMDPYEAPLVSLINADGSWFCPGCHSLNRPGSPHCYSCRAAYPLAVPSRAPRGQSQRSAAGSLLISLVLLVGSASAVFGRTNLVRRPAASTPLAIAVEVIETSSPSPESTASLSPTPTETARVPTVFNSSVTEPSVPPTAPAPSAPTAPPTSNAPPTAAPTPTPTPEPTAAPTS